MAAANHPAGATSALDEAYAAETGAIIRQRVTVAAIIYTLAVAILGTLDVGRHPDHLAALVWRLVVHAITCSVGVGTILRPRFVRHVRAIATGFTAGLTLQSGFYYAAIALPVDRYALYLACLQTGMAVIFPWGGICQGIGSIASLIAFVGASPYLAGAEGRPHAVIALVAAAGATTFGAHFFQRSRRAAFLQSVRQRQEAEVAAALVRVSETLSTHVRDPDMVDRVNRLAVDVVGCDVTLTFLWNAERRVYVLGSAAGIRDPQKAEALKSIEFPPGTLGLDAQPAGVVAELSRDDPGVGGAALRTWGIGSALVTMMARGDEMIGTMVHCRRDDAGRFGEQQKRLASGIAHAAAIAIENARLIQDLETASRIKSEFVSTMSHELRTPLNVILGFAEMARDPNVSAEERDHCLARVDAAGRDLLMLIDDTLELSRMEAGRDEVKLQPVDLRDLWTSLGTAVRRLPCAPTVSLVWSDDVPPAELVTDPRKVTVIVRNLVGNALKFTPRGSVRGEAHLDGAEVVIRIADTGVGIAPSDRELIFEMFRQADGSDTRQHGGVGLGLHIVRRTVQQLGGSLGLESELGNGSVFTVRLPARCDRARRAA